VVIVRWHYYDPNPDPWAWYAQVDDVTITRSDDVCKDATYDNLDNAVVYTGTLSQGSTYPAVTPEDGSFENGPPPASAWTEWANNSCEWIVDASTAWGIPSYDGSFAYWGGGYCGLDASTDYVEQEVSLTGSCQLSFAANYYRPDPDDASLDQLYIDIDGSEVWAKDLIIANDTYPNWTVEGPIALGTFDGESVMLRIGVDSFDSTGNVLVDDVVIECTEEIIVYNPSCEIDITVLITDTVAPDTWITNTATLQAFHDMPQGIEVEEPVSTSVYTHIGMEDFVTSYKEATAETTTGGIIAYEIHVINSGDALASVTITDTIPAGTTLVYWDDSPPYEHFGYNAAEGQMEWSGNITPGEEWVFYYEVEVDEDPALWGTTIENTAYISWDDNVMPLMAETVIVPPSQVFLPLVIR
jgi:uncharacterized repeat protein (TIGR01451 family)